jgi:hypothetical protein
MCQSPALLVAFLWVCARRRWLTLYSLWDLFEPDGGGLWLAIVRAESKMAVFLAAKSTFLLQRSANEDRRFDPFGMYGCHVIDGYSTGG